MEITGLVDNEREIKEEQEKTRGREPEREVNTASLSLCIPRVHHSHPERQYLH